MHPSARLAAAAAIALAACGFYPKGDRVTTAPAPADLVIRNARLHDPVDGIVGSELAIRGGRIVALGGVRATDKWVGLQTRVFDAGGGAVVPGLSDAHGHFLALGFDLDRADLRGARSEAAMAARAADFAKDRPEGWLVGRGWDQNLWPGAQFPTKAAIDAALPGRAVWLVRVDGHAALASTEALRAAGVSRETQDPPGGRVARDASGEPTGLLVDAAMDLVSRAIPAPSEGDRERAALAAQEAVLRAGLTCVHDAGLSFAEQATLRRLDAEGKLRVRIYGMASAGAIPTAPHRGRRFELRAVKAYADGALGSRGAALLAPYSDDPNNTGLLVSSERELDAVAAACLGRGFQLCTHAIGDRGNRVVLDAYARAFAPLPPARARALRWRVEHCQVIAPEDFARFASLGLVASMQPTHATSDGPWAPARLGAERMEGAYAWRRFLALGVPLAFGSDFPVESHDPKLGLFAAVTRRPPDDPKAAPFGPGEPLTAREALAAFTTGAARAAFAEAERGRLREGMLADVTVFDSDPFSASDPAAYLRARVVWTVVEGAVEFPRR